VIWKKSYQNIRKEKDKDEEINVRVNLNININIMSMSMSISSPKFLLSLMLISTSLAMCFSTPLEWAEVTPTTTIAPPTRKQHGICYDRLRNRVIIWGGRGLGIFNDTWEFDLTTKVWREIRTSLSPPPRHTFVYGVDHRRRRQVFNITLQHWRHPFYIDSNDYVCVCVCVCVCVFSIIWGFIEYNDYTDSLPVCVCVGSCACVFMHNWLFAHFYWGELLLNEMMFLFSLH